jgi:serine/threonine-protein kinase
MSVSLLSMPAAVGQEGESDGLLLRRSRIALGLGLAVSVALLSVGEIRVLIAGRPSPSASERWVYTAYIGVFLLGFLGSFLGRGRASRIRWLDLAVTAGLLVVLAADTVLHTGDYPPLALVALILFGAAALIPWTVAFQAGLVGASLAAVPVVRILLDRGVGDPGWWSWPVLQSDPASGALFGAVGVALLGGVSVAITGTLYDLRERARVAERLGGYTLLERLGEGGAGAVYLAEHCRMCRPSAVKIITASPDHDSALISRFQREIEMASRLDHPNTIEIRDYGRADDSTFFLAMEYLVGLDLHHLVRRFGPIPPQRTVHILRQVCDSLAEAHDKGIVHRDLKPANVFVTRRGGICDFVKVLDFGLAKLIDSSGEDTITSAGAIVGTPHYMAPEAIDGPGYYEARSDLYSLGCTAYWMLAGRPPYEGATAPEVIAAHVRREPVPIDAASEFEMPEILARAVMRCMSKEVGDRFDGALELKASLESIAFEQPWTAESAREWWNLHLSDEPGRASTSSPRTPALSGL